LATDRLLGQFATTKLTGATQCRNEHGARQGHRREGFDV